MRTVAMVAVIAVLLGCAGCTSEQESAISEVVSVMEDIGDRLAQIKTRDDIAKAQPDLKRLGERMRTASRNMEKMESLNHEQQQQLQSKYQDRLARAQARMQDQMERISRELGADAMLQVGTMLEV